MQFIGDIVSNFRRNEHRPSKLYRTFTCLLISTTENYEGMHGGICRMEESPVTSPGDAEIQGGKKGWGISSAVRSNGSVPSCE